MKLMKPKRSTENMKWRHTKLTVHNEMYLEQKKIIGELIKKAKIEYYTNKVLKCGIDQKALSKVIDTLQAKLEVLYYQLVTH